MKHVWKCLYLSIYANSISTLWEQQVFLNVVHARYLIVILVYSFTLAKSVVPMYLWIFVGCRMLLKWIQNSHDWGNFWTVEFCTNNFEYIAVLNCSKNCVCHGNFEYNFINIFYVKKLSILRHSYQVTLAKGFYRTELDQME